VILLSRKEIELKMNYEFRRNLEVPLDDLKKELFYLIVHGLSRKQ
jgi:hypothetical protein